MLEVTLYQVLGGEEGLKKLVDAFYQVMSDAPEAKGILKMHPDLPRANQKLFEFLSGWLGGPDLFVQKYGHPRLRARHLPFAIGISERDQWLFCMKRALEICNTSPEFNSMFMSAIARLADHMRNQSEGPHGS
ncbi:MAG: group II truncated hemoglobin [Bdellovibrionaceae bacterium]|nr:group II truncated hemoglobin [Pseudobdellovibrionaceae bacterium]